MEEELVRLERNVQEQATRLNVREDFVAWERRCDECLEKLEEHSRSKRPRLSVGSRHSLIAKIARLEGLRNELRRRFVRTGAGHGLTWREIDTAFASRISTGAIVNANHVEPRHFLEDAKKTVLEHVQSAIEEHGSIKVNTLFNGEFVSGDKRANKSINTKNCELHRTSDLDEWYERRIVEPTLAALDEFQERDSGWALSRIHNLTVNVNKYNPMRAGCHIHLSREIQLKKAVINVQSTDNACFAWSVVAALYPAQTHVDRASSYPHYTTVLKLQGIDTPMSVQQIAKFERLNDISINVYTVETRKKKDGAYEKTVLPIRLTEQKRQKHVNLLHAPDRRDVNPGHFACIKNLSRLVSAQLNKTKGRKYICDRYVVKTQKTVVQQSPVVQETTHWK